MNSICKKVVGGLLVQTPDLTRSKTRAQAKVVTRRAPTDAELAR